MYRTGLLDASVSDHRNFSIRKYSRSLFSQSAKIENKTRVLRAEPRNVAELAARFRI
jgi:hypothetical protein